MTVFGKDKWFWFYEVSCFACYQFVGISIEFGFVLGTRDVSWYPDSISFYFILSGVHIEKAINPKNVETLDFKPSHPISKLQKAEGMKKILSEFCEKC